eukprot:4700600-Karenia_brevis.AAC.1
MALRQLALTFGYIEPQHRTPMLAEFFHSHRKESHHQNVISKINVHVDISNLQGPGIERELSAASHLDSC